LANAGIRHNVAVGDLCASLRSCAGSDTHLQT